jgi:RecA/RadA recombinase
MTGISMKMIESFKKDLKKYEKVSIGFPAPGHWYHTGNFALNKIMSGTFSRGIPERRITILAGESGAGKTFLGCNIVKNAQEDGAFIIYLDSENAVDTAFLTKIGVDCSPEKMLYMQVVTIDDVTSIMSGFFSNYIEQYGTDNPDAPKVVVVLDSIDMLLTEKEDEDFEKGDRKGDMGQRTKQLKHALRTIVSRLSRTNIAFLATHQVYANQDLLNGQGKWIVNNAVRYSASQIILVSKLKLKEGTEVAGIRMKCETFKSRFAKLGSTIEIEVPYAKGMNPYSGLLLMLVEKGVIKQGGAWYTYVDMETGEETKFQQKQLNGDLVAKFLSHPIIVREEHEIGNDIESEHFEINKEVAELSDDAE